MAKIFEDEGDCVRPPLGVLGGPIQRTEKRREECLAVREGSSYF